jgi:hypothetical protein
MQENHELRNQQANLPLFNIEMTSTQMTCESSKRGRGEVKSCSPFFLFQIAFIYFRNFLILSNAKVSKNKYAVEKEKRKWWIWGEKKFKCKWWKKGVSPNEFPC